MSAEQTGLDALLRSAAPGRRPVDEDRVFTDVWARLETAFDDGDQPRDDLQSRRLDLVADREVSSRRRRRAAKVASITLAVAVAGAGTAAAADFWATHTGEVTTGWEVDAGGRGEVLRLDGTDRDQVFDELTADIPFPAGYEAQREYALGFYPAEANHAVTEGTLRSSVARYAVCTWADAWVAADDASNAAARNAATETLVAAVSWPDIHDNDHPDATITEAGEHISYNAWVPVVAEAARSGDRQGVLDGVADSTACSYHVLPVIDVTPGYRYAGVR
jgi:hypothetical protein